MKVLIRGGRVFDPTQNLHGEPMDLGIAAGRLVTTADLGVPDREIAAQGLAVTAAALDPAAWVAPPEALQLRVRFRFPTLETIGRRYAERGYCHVHQPFATPLTALAVRRQLACLPLLEGSVGLALPLLDLDPWPDPDTAAETAERLGALIHALGTQGLYLAAPELKYRLEVYRHKDLGADRVLPVVGELARRLHQPLSLPAASLGEDDWDRLPAGTHLHRLAELEDGSGPGGGLAKAFAALNDADRGGDSAAETDPIDPLERTPVTADLGWPWREPTTVARWRREGEPGRGWIVDHGLMRDWVWERREGHDFRRDPEADARLRRLDSNRLALTAAAAHLALIEDWSGFLEALLEIFGLDGLLRLTRVTPARALCQADRGHLKQGARADLAGYPLPADESPRAWAQSLARCRILIRAGRLVLGPDQPPELACPQPPEDSAEGGAESASSALGFLDAGLTLRPQTLARGSSPRNRRGRS